MHPQGQRRIIGVTGGLGMGKTTVSEYLQQVHQLPVLDADLYAREAVETGSQVLTDIVDRYGSSILLPDGELDRRRLGDIIFNSPAERLWLEQRIHPFVRDRIQRELRSLDPQTHPTIVLVVPLLFEARMTDLVTEIWVVSSSAEQQQTRLQERDRMSLTQIKARIESQMAIERKAKQADVLIENSASREALYQQVDQALGSSAG
ncbi:MAG: dephospho-CoA kinase [Oculatellaceae cyanobacterium Prado106]|nr:dephospho-CoA kinase [Oculatellaceae cyanobacterium Prado106]